MGEVGIVERKKAPTLSEFGKRFMETIETHCADKPATVSFYRAKLEYLQNSPALADARPDAIDEDVIEAYKRARSKEKSRGKRPLAPASINRELATLRLAAEPLGGVAMLLLDCGLRNTEARLLEWPDLHLNPATGAHFGYMTVRAFNSKNSKPRNVPLSERAVSMLRQHGPKNSGLVFSRVDGSELTAAELDQVHNRIRKLLRLTAEFVLHSLRHTFGTRLGEAGADAFTIMKLMGHSSVTVFQRYVRPSPEAVERAYERLQQLNQTKSSAVEGVPTNSPTLARDKNGRLEQVF